MLRGSFDAPTGRPYIEGRLLIPKLSIRSNVSWCVDTGADNTVLLPTDGDRMRIDYSLLTEEEEPSVGLGGATYSYVESAIVMFNEPGKAIHAYQIDLLIVEPDPDLMILPSILGRDILNQWRMRYFPTSNHLTFDVITADITIPIQ